jgi:homoserine O-succinyltransferase
MIIPEPRSRDFTPARVVHRPSGNCIDIGLLNNMPDAALEATERQFRALLDAAAPRGVAVRLRLFALPGVPRGDAGREYVSQHADIAALWKTRLDGLIVTGTEPRSPSLEEEPYWNSLTQVMDWAEDNTHSSVWSCLAAHAAVLHLDGIKRHPLPDKRFGIFDSSPSSNEPLTAASPSSVRMPHSRWNDLPEGELVARGYRVMLRSAAGVDAFTRRRKSLFVFFQGHPEYDADTLLLEYRRDVKRFLRGERETYPPLPHGYFDEETVAALTAIQQRAVVDRREELLADFPDGLSAKVRNTWGPAAAFLYRNWLRYLSTQKAQRLRATSRQA